MRCIRAVSYSPPVHDVLGLMINRRRYRDRLAGVLDAREPEEIA